MSKQIRHLTSQAGEWLWQKRFNRMHSSDTGLKGDPSHLRLVLGLAGSAPDWLAGLIARSAPRVRFYNDPLKRLTPPMVLSPGPDRCSIGFAKTLPAGHPLLRVMRMLVEPDNVWASERMSNRLPHAAYDPEPCLVKESRALLAAEALIRGLGAWTLLVLSEPVRAVDDMFSQQGLETRYLDYEDQAVLSPVFLARFLPRDRAGVLASARIIGKLPASRARRILARAMTIGLLNRMFLMLAARYPSAAAVSINRLACSPRATLQLIVEVLGDHWRESAELQVTDACAQLPGRELGALRLNVPALNEPLRFLSVKEAVACRDMLAESALAGKDTDELLNNVVGVTVFPTRRGPNDQLDNLLAPSAA